MSKTQLPKVFYFTNLASVYRTRLWQVLLESKNFEISFGYGANKKLGIKSIDFSAPFFSDKENRLFRLTNFWIKKKYMPWQAGVISLCLFKRPKAVIFMGDATVLSYWLAAIICRLKSIKVIYHTHGFYGDEKGLKLKFRKAFYALATEYLSYEKRGKTLMIEQGFSPDKIHVFYNSLDYPRHLELREALQNKKELYTFDFFEKPTTRTLIFIGRLTFEKKLDMLINVVNQINLNQQLNLLIIGDGESRNQLETLIDEDSKKFIHLYGPCYDEKLIGEMLYNSYLCVSPGNVGLTAIHSLSFGTPVCTHENFNNQGPEVESIVDGKTGFLFEENNLDDLKNKIIGWTKRHPNKTDIIRNDCYQIVDEFYNPFNQERVLTNLINGGLPLDKI